MASTINRIGIVSRIKIMFMTVTMESAVFMGKNYQNNCQSIVNTTDLTLKQMFDISTKLCPRKMRSQDWKQPKPPGLHTTAREPKRAHLRAPRASNTKIQREDTQRETKRAKMVREREKKRAKF